MASSSSSSSSPVDVPSSQRDSENTNKQQGQQKWAQKNCCSAAKLLELNNRPGSLAEHRTMKNPVKQDSDGNRRKLKLKFDVRNFRAEEISVSLDIGKRCINVEGNHQFEDVE